MVRLVTLYLFKKMDENNDSSAVTDRCLNASILIRTMKNNFSLHRRRARVTRLNKLVIMVAFLWFVASIALLLFASGSAHAAQPSKHAHQKPVQQMANLRPTRAAAYS
jgi:preprotein translocase subunit SecG